MGHKKKTKLDNNSSKKIQKKKKKINLLSLIERGERLVRVVNGQSKWTKKKGGSGPSGIIFVRNSDDLSNDKSWKFF